MTPFALNMSGSSRVFPNRPGKTQWHLIISLLLPPLVQCHEFSNIGSCRDWEHTRTPSPILAGLLSKFVAPISTLPMSLLTWRYIYLISLISAQVHALFPIDCSCMKLWLLGSHYYILFGPTPYLFFGWDNQMLLQVSSQILMMPEHNQVSSFLIWIARFLTFLCNIFDFQKKIFMSKIVFFIGKHLSLFLRVLLF
jgi:hypothetical protein